MEPQLKIWRTRDESPDRRSPELHGGSVVTLSLNSGSGVYRGLARRSCQSFDAGMARYVGDMRNDLHGNCSVNLEQSDVSD